MRQGPPSTLTSILALALVVAGAAGAVGAPAAEPADIGQSHLEQQDEADPLAPNGTLIALQLSANGDARWTVSQRFVLNDSNDTRAFNALAGEFEAGETSIGYLDAFAQGREFASESTGREMRFANVTRSTRVEARGNASVGVLEVGFTWTNFGRTSPGIVAVDDVLLIDDGNGTWFPGLTASETFVVRPPAEYAVSSAPAATNQGVLRWEGLEEFEPGYLDVTYERLAKPTDSATPSDGAPPDSPVLPPTGDRETLLLVGGLVGLGLLAVLAYLLARRDADEPGEDGGTPTGADGGAAVASTNGGTEATEAEPEPVDTTLLSDEERVEHLLERNGGRMRQANIVKQTGWSNAKVSQLLSAMDEDDRVDKLRIGRENLISLPDEDVTGVEE
jgi:hypothetical protein